jgi:hypothetical protein
MSLLRSVLILPLLASLVACDESRFVVDPLGEARLCEPQLAGNWRIVDDPDGAAEYLLVDTACNVRLVRGPRPGEGASTLDESAQPSQVELAPSIGRIGGVTYATLTDAQYHRAGGEDDAKPAHLDQRDGFHVFRIEASRDRIVLRAVDHQALARAIVDDQVKGEVSKTEDGLKNVVLLDSAGVVELLDESWLFRKADPLQLQRVATADLPARLRARVEAAR